MVEISKDDKAFLKTVEESTITSGDHYVVPLPFKKENLIMPNNRKQAMQRLIYLKRRFKKDPAFFEDYKHFMSNLLVKGYAKGWMIHQLERRGISRIMVCTTLVNQEKSE